MMPEEKEIPNAGITMFKHDLGQGGYALLTVIETPELVLATLASTKTFPPVPNQFEAVDMKAGIEFIEGKFAEEFPEHICTSACHRHWEQMSGPDDPAGTSKAVN
jgi:hypothetical protein